MRTLIVTTPSGTTLDSISVDIDKVGRPSKIAYCR